MCEKVKARMGKIHQIKKPNLHDIRVNTLKRVTSGGSISEAYPLGGTARNGVDSALDFTGPGIEHQTSRTDSVCITATKLTGQ